MVNEWYFEKIIWIIFGFVDVNVVKIYTFCKTYAQKFHKVS